MLIPCKYKALARLGCALFICVASVANADDGPIAVFQRDGHKIEVFDTQGSCARNAGLEAYRTPAVIQDKPYDIGCWKPMDEKSAVVIFKDGSLIIFDRREFLRRRPAQQISL
jgi:hypothetical protein